MNQDQSPDSYGKGRTSVINELLLFCDKEIEKIMAHGIDKDTHIAASMSGQYKTFNRLKQRLNGKLQRVKCSPQAE